MDADRWTAAIDAALTDVQIAGAIRTRSNGITEKRLRAHLQKQKDVIEHDVRKEFQNEEQVARALDQVRADASQSGITLATDVFSGLSRPDLANAVVHDPPRKNLSTEERLGLNVLRENLASPRWTSYLGSAFLRNFALLALFVSLPAAILAVFQTIAIFRTGLTPSSSPLGSRLAGAAALVLCGTWIAIYLLDRLLVLRERRRLTSFVLEAAARIGIGLKKFETEADQLDTTLTAARATSVRVLENSLRERTRLFIDTQTQPNYSDVIPAFDASGLAEVFDADQIIPTATREELIKKMESMPGGSIGVAGPRGAGKSTIVKSITEEPQLRTSSSSRSAEPASVLGVFTSAPVRYDGREFILHLFTCLCEALFQPEGNRADSKAWERGLTRDQRQQVSRFEPAALFAIRNAVPLAGFFGLVLIVASLWRVFFESSSIGKFLIKLEFKPATAIPEGVILIFVAYTFDRFLAHLIRPESRVEDAPSPLSRNARAMPSAFDGHKEEWEKLIEIAQEWYVELRYQRSYTAGWSGSLKLPIGLEGSVNQAASLASRQLSMPEIVDAYAKFVKLLTPWFVVVIGVDELDKIAAAEKAQEFLNEIKSVFGIDRCFYLISISDSAMSSFARRGLPVRDAFDSAFDEVIRVGYMTFEDTRQLLARRVIGLPRPVVAFCHAFSGGLPRDVIRACRALFNHAEGSRQRRLSEIVRLLIRADLGAKIEASTTYVLDAPPSPATAAALSALWKLQEAVAKDEDLESHYNALKAVADVSLLAGHAASTADIETSRRSAAETSADLAAYILYCSTLTSIFAAYPSGDEWVKADKRGYFAEVARFRRYLGISSQNAVTEIGSFRTSRSISPQLLLHVAAPPRVARPRKAVSKVPIPKRKPPITPARARQSKSTN